MPNERLTRALARIDQAAARLEAAARSPAASTGAVPDAAHADLERRHAALRAAAGEALARLDRLIAAEPERG